MLSHPSVEATPARLGAVEPTRSARTEALIASERAAAYAEGVQAGLAEAAAAQRAQLEATVSDLRAVVEEQIVRLTVSRADHDRALLEEAAQIARYVVDLVDATAVDALVDRIRAALDELDDVDLVAHVAAAQVDAVSGALGGTGVRVVAADDVHPGDGRLIGRWSIADVGQQRRWDAVREALDHA